MISCKTNETVNVQQPCNPIIRGFLKRGNPSHHGCFNSAPARGLRCVTGFSETSKRFCRWCWSRSRYSCGNPHVWICPRSGDVLQVTMSLKMLKNVLKNTKILGNTKEQIYHDICRYLELKICKSYVLLGKFESSRGSLSTVLVVSS